MSEHPMPPSPSRPDAPTVVESQTTRLANALSRNDRSLVPLNRLVAEQIVRHVLTEIESMAEAWEILDHLVKDRPHAMSVVAQRLRKTARIVDPSLQRQVITTQYRRAPLDLKEI